MLRVIPDTSAVNLFGSQWFESEFRLDGYLKAMIPGKTDPDELCFYASLRRAVWPCGISNNFVQLPFCILNFVSRFLTSE